MYRPTDSQFSLYAFRMIVNSNIWQIHALKRLQRLLVDVFACVCVLVTQLCPTLCDPLDYSPPGSSVHRILQKGILEWITVPFSNI